MGPTRKNLVLNPLAVQHLDNQLCIYIHLNSRIKVRNSDHHCTHSYCDSLLLSTADSHSSFSNHRLVSLGKIADEQVSVGSLCGLKDLLVRGGRSSVTNVFEDGGREEDGLLSKQDRCYRSICQINANLVNFGFVQGARNPV